MNKLKIKIKYIKNSITEGKKRKKGKKEKDRSSKVKTQFPEAETEKVVK